MNPAILQIIMDAINAVVSSNSLDDEIVDLKQRIAEHETDLANALQAYDDVRRSGNPLSDDDVARILGSIPSGGD